jgi:hypothetical protein
MNELQTEAFEKRKHKRRKRRFLVQHRKMQRFSLKCTIGVLHSVLSGVRTTIIITGDHLFQD